jgi:putative hydrolase of the HAD superfamily
MITTMLFDVDGVLATGDPWHKDLSDSYDITPQMLSPFFSGPFQRCLLGQADLKEELAHYLPRWNWPHSVEAFVDYWFCRHTLDGQLIATIQQLRQLGIHCYLATQQERYRTAYLWHDMDLASSFDGMFSSVSIGYMKDKPAFFTSILASLADVQPGTILFWDDTLANVITARSVRIIAEVYRDFAQFQVKVHEYLNLNLL